MRDTRRRTPSGPAGWPWAAVAGGIAAGALARSVARPPVDLRGKVALVTGGSRGLGLLLARELAGNGCRLAICARDPGDLGLAAFQLRQLGGEVLPVVCDVSDQDQAEGFVRQTVERFGSIDVVVNNAGIMQVGPLGVMTIADFREALDVMFWGPVFVTLAALPHLRARRGHIVNITSIGGKISVPHLLPYVCAKFAAVGFSQGVRTAVAADVRVTTVVPGLMRTGSHLRAVFKGDPAREYTWFALGSGVPVLSMDAERAARRIVTAVRRGQAELVLPRTAHVAVRLHGLLPEVTGAVMVMVNRLLPTGTDPAARVSGTAARDKADTPILRLATSLADQAAHRFNQLAG